jgi:hypothetical protein
MLIKYIMPEKKILLRVTEENKLSETKKTFRNPLLSQLD